MWTEPSTRTGVESVTDRAPRRELTSDATTAGPSYWTRIGSAYKNRDGSLNLRFNYLPADLANTTIQVREPRAKVDDAAADASAAE